MRHPRCIYFYFSKVRVHNLTITACRAAAVFCPHSHGSTQPQNIFQSISEIFSYVSRIAGEGFLCCPCNGVDYYNFHLLPSLFFCKRNVFHVKAETLRPEYLKSFLRSPLFRCRKCEHHQSLSLFIERIGYRHTICVQHADKIRNCHINLTISVGNNMLILKPDLVFMAFKIAGTPESNVSRKLTEVSSDTTSWG